MKAKTRKKIAKLAEAWQRCRQEDLPKVFYAYDAEEKQTERVVTYELPDKHLKLLASAATQNDQLQLVVHLGLHEGRLTERVPDQPAFALLLELRLGKKAVAVHELTWLKNGRFSTNMSVETQSLTNAIPAAGAFLFVHSWMQMPEADLAAPFTAASRVLGQRVKSYIFSVVESRSILEDIIATGAKGLQVHLGNGLAVWSHPFSFRPVVDVVDGAPDEDSSLERRALFTGQAPGNDDDNSYYDYSIPNPPGEP